jgi:hypothetical protein
MKSAQVISRALEDEKIRFDKKNKAIAKEKEFKGKDFEDLSSAQKDELLEVIAIRLGII